MFSSRSAKLRAGPVTPVTLPPAAPEDTAVRVGRSPKNHCRGAWRKSPLAPLPRWVRIRGHRTICSKLHAKRGLSVGGDDARHGRRADIVESRHLGAGLAAGEALLQTLVKAHDGLCWRERVAQAAAGSIFSLTNQTASARAEAPIPKARSTMRASPRISRVMLKAAACPLRNAKPLIVA